MFALEQLVNVTNWIHDFNPQNVNFMDLNLPRNLRTLDDYSHVAVKDYPKPNRMVEISRDSIEVASGGGKSSFAVHVKSLTS